TKPTRQLILDLSLGTGLMVGAVAGIGWFLSGLAIEPVRESYQRLKQFTADASHELRNPIATIQTNVQVALADPNPDLPFQQHQLRVIERLTRRLGRLVDDLLFLARQDSGIVQPNWTMIALDDLLEDVTEEQQLIATEKNLTLSLDSPATSQTAPKFQMQGDRDQLARLFTNLLANAVQYTPAGGSVQVELQRLGRPNHAHLQVKIRDTGVGIPEEAIPQLFDRFYRVDPARTAQKEAPKTTGSGLGLAIARAIVENHHGQIQVESQIGKGTTFTVMLPEQMGNG
ncbi:MAG: HAMP domain-containing sensor histidine kinase, partial [Leptolyngbyaceae cyanobacterium bins.59]|nr:HAMP domain-containing sensor histidine kinase [Leptolyngbyaceae cyanobacterium bins.59]